MRNLILLGPPGAGKGTQAVQVAATMGLAHVATGDMFRDNVRASTELGRLAQQYMERGELVPDTLTIQMLLERLARPDAANGVLLDGFPRTVEQAQALDRALRDRHQQVDLVLLIEVHEAEIQKRLALRGRTDDAPETISRRLWVYDAQTAPLIAYYDQAGKLQRIDGEQTPEAVTRALLAALGRNGR